MEIALIPGVLAMGESIACHLAYAACEYNEGAPRSSRQSHPGIYSNPKAEDGSTRSHLGVYSKPMAQHARRVGHTLPSVPERESCTCAASIPIEEPQSPEHPRRVSSECVSVHADLPVKASLLRPSEERFGPSAAARSFASDCNTCKQSEGLSKESFVITSALPYLLSFKQISGDSKSTASTCSDLDTSCTLSVVSLNVSNSSEPVSPRSVCNDVEPMEQRDYSKSFCRTCPMDPREGGLDVPSSKAREFCQKARADCDLENLDEEMQALTKDLEALRASAAQARNVLLYKPIVN